MFRLLDRATQLTNLKKETSFPEPTTCESALKTTAQAAMLLFAHGQTTERTVTAAERLGRALGVTVKVLLYWGELTVELDGAPISQIVPAKRLGVDMGRVLAITAVIDQVCHGTLSAKAAQSALESAGRLPPASTPRFTLLTALGAASLGVIFGTLDATSLLLIAASAAIGALIRRWLSGFSNKMPWRLLAFPIVAGMLAHAARWALISVAGTNAATGALVACMLVSSS